MELKKLVSYIKMYWKTSVVYKLSFMASIVISPLMLLMTFFIWKAVFSTADVIKGYTFEDIIAYYVIGMLVNHFIFNMVGNALQDKIISGELTDDLLKPFPIFGQLLASDIAERAFAFFVEVIPVFIISFFIFKLQVTFYVFFFLMSMILAFFLNFMIGYLMGLLAFWISKIESMQWLMFLGIRFLSGEHIPLEFFGQGFLFVSRFMPFYYIRYGVIQVYLGKFGIIGSLQFMFIQLVWVIILFYLIKLIWSIALKRYGAVG